MSKVFVHMGMSLDGYIAGPNGGPKTPLGEGGIAIHSWMFEQKAFRQHLNMGDDGKTGLENDLIEATFQRIGANIMGKRMFVEGEANWPEEAPFNCPVFVHTHEKREPWVRKGGTTFYFVNEGLESVLKRARDAAGAKDVRISGGADVVRQYLNAGLVDELVIAMVPLILGKGVRLFEGIDPQRVSFEIADVVSSPVVTQMRYRVKRK